MNNGWTRFVVFLFAEQHLLEYGQRGKDRTADPDLVFPLGWGNDLDFHYARS